MQFFLRGVCVRYVILLKLGTSVFFSLSAFRTECDFCFLEPLRMTYVLRVFAFLFKCLCFRWYCLVRLFSFKAELVTAGIFLHDILEMRNINRRVILGNSSSVIDILLLFLK